MDLSIHPCSCRCKLSPLTSGSCDFKLHKVLKMERFSVDTGEVIGPGIRRDGILVTLGTALISIYNKTLTQGCTIASQEKARFKSRKASGEDSTGSDSCMGQGRENSRRGKK